MIGFAELDLMVRGGTVAMLVLWSWLLIRDYRHALAARIAVAMNLTIICHVVASVPGSWGKLGVLNALLDTGSSAVIGLFWLFSRAWFEDVRRISWRSWVAVALPSLFVGILDLSQLGETLVYSRIWFPILRTIWFAFAIHGLWVAWRGRDGDLVEARRRIRFQLVATVGALCVLVNIVEIAVFVFGAPSAWRSISEFGIMLSTLILCGAMFGLRQQDMFASQQVPDDAKAPSIADPALAERLTAHMESNRIWRDEKLSIAGLAAQLGEQEYRLRRLINGQLGHRNFAAFLNGYRLAEVKSALADPSQRDVPILTIALDAGFGSLGPFNRAFREAEGMTPSEYRARG
jgi:AraC-like DNA-binding protein